MACRDADSRTLQIWRSVADHVDVEAGPRLAQIGGQGREVDGDGAGGGERDGGQRPDRRAGVAQAGEDPFGDARRRVGMPEAQLGTQVVRPAAGDQRMRPRLVQLRVVQHDQAGVAGEVGPHVVVAACIAELVDDQIERLGVMDGREVVGGPDGSPGRSDRGKPVRAHAGLGSSRRPDVVTDEQRDVVARGESREHHGAVAGDAGADRRERREPGETHLDGGEAPRDDPSRQAPRD